LVVYFYEILNCGDKVWHAMENAYMDPLSGEFRKPSLDKIQQQGTGRNEMDVESWMF